MMFVPLKHYDILEKIVSGIRGLYDQSTFKNCLQRKLLEPFAIATCVLKDDVLAPFLFIILINYVSKISAGYFVDQWYLVDQSIN